jgi:hypothetical protein
MLHAWIWASNPAGMFETDNWAIPYLRLGITPTRNAPLSAALALSLLTGGTEYFSASIEAALSPTPQQVTAIKNDFLQPRSNQDYAKER